MKSSPAMGKTSSPSPVIRKRGRPPMKCKHVKHEDRATSSSARVSHDHPRKTARSGLSNRIYASDEARQYAIKRAKEVQSGLDPDYPSFTKAMTQSHVSGGFWLSLPRSFCKSYLSKEDIYMTLIDEDLNPFKSLFLAEKNGLSAGWRGFAVAHELADGDAVVFHLVDATTFKVYIIRASALHENKNIMSHIKKNTKRKAAQPPTKTKGQSSIPVKHERKPARGELCAPSKNNLSDKNLKSLPSTGSEQSMESEDSLPRADIEQPPTPMEGSQHMDQEVQQPRLGTNESEQHTESEDFLAREDIEQSPATMEGDRSSNQDVEEPPKPMDCRNQYMDQDVDPDMEARTSMTLDAEHFCSQMEGNQDTNQSVDLNVQTQCGSTAGPSTTTNIENCFQCIQLKEEMDLLKEEMKCKALEAEKTIKENEELCFRLIKQKTLEAEQATKKNEEMKSCKVCMDNDVSMLLLPCRHFCLCKVCDAVLHVCPICGNAKVTSVEIFMS